MTDIVSFIQYFFYLLPWRLPLRNHTFSIRAINLVGIFHWGHNVFSTLVLYSIGAISHVFSIGTMFKYWPQFNFLSIAFHIAYAIFGSNHWKVFLEICAFWNQTHWIKIWTHYNDREDQHHHFGDVKLLLIICIKKILLSWL